MRHISLRLQVLRKKLKNIHFILASILLLLFMQNTVNAQALMPVEKHGALSIVNGQLVNQDKKAVSLAGPSLFWSNNGWNGENYYTKEIVKTMATDWKAGVIRAAMGADSNGSYLDFPIDNQKRVETVVDAAIINNIYVIIDWHSHHAENNIDQAITFFQAMATKYGKNPHVIYEIYNEPLNNTDWSSVIKPYAEKVIAAIRKIDPDNVIIVGTQTWSQDVDLAAKNPIIGFDNIAYALHFYAGTHKADLRKKAQIALDAGLAIFVSEWGTVNANGDGSVDVEESNRWLAFIKENKLSHCSWAVSNKNEGAAMLKENASLTGPWPDDQLTINGLFLKDKIKHWND